MLRGHPWIFSGAIAEFDTQPADGDWVKVFDSRQHFLALGCYTHGGSIAIRVYGRSETDSAHSILRHRLSEAFAMRTALELPSRQTNMYRLCHGEGDGLPGLIIDIYGTTAVVQCHTLGMYLIRKLIAELLVETSDDRVLAVFDKSRATLKSAATEDLEDGYLIGGPTAEILMEGGLTYAVDFVNGQKTGFFIDQREHRALLGRYSSGKRVLNTFCYTGGFSVAALAGGATEVRSVDSSAGALVLTEQNVAAGNFSGRHEALKADAVEYIRSIEANFDIIVLDPPAFAKNQRARHNAVQAYKRLNKAAIERVAKRGLIFTFSCSQAVDASLFQGAVMAGAIEAKRNVKILHWLRQPPDHPASLFHPEGEYLKGLVLAVE